MQERRDKKLYFSLLEAYSEKNLNSITTKIVNTYKEKRLAYIRELNRIVNDCEVDKKEKISKIFSKLIMLFHPDKHIYYKNEIENCFQNEQDERLIQLSKILLILEVDEKNAGSGLLDNDFSFEAEYVWDFEESGFSYFTEDEDNLFDIKPEKHEESHGITTFFSALKRREYGNINIDFPVHQLYDYEELELADYEIEDLDGIEFCKHLISLDLSNNMINDISRLALLKSLEELYLANNNIYFIDRIHQLKKLRVLDISNNKLEDISSLFHLNELEYLNIAGNKISADQIENLKSKGVIIIK